MLKKARIIGAPVQIQTCTGTFILQTSIMSDTHEYTVEELERYKGEGVDGCILVALNGHVYDVTQNGGRFYGKGNK